MQEQAVLITLLAWLWIFAHAEALASTGEVVDDFLAAATTVVAAEDTDGVTFAVVEAARLTADADVHGTVTIAEQKAKAIGYCERMLNSAYIPLLQTAAAPPSSRNGTADAK